MKKLSLWMLLCALAWLPALAGAAAISVSYVPYGGELVNPLIGNVAWADGDAGHEQPFTLVYANLTWAELEPEEGRLDFASFEERNHFDRWRAEGKRLILRFVMDVPTKRRHADIPDWLMDRAGGAYYSCPYGRGYCPDYAQEALIEAHARVIRALGQRYDGDPFVAYVELGSLGHWGEWHVHSKAGKMPGEPVRDRYAQAYRDAFTQTPLMMRRPFRFAAQNGIGLYNDAAGQPEETQTWLDWIAHGGAYDVTGETDALAPMPDAWMTAPVGGELTTSIKKTAHLRAALEQTISLFERSHASWIGPGSFVDIARGGEDQAALDRLMQRIGYRLRISGATIDTDAHTLTLEWTNDGVAPFYHDWKPCVRFTEADGTQHILALNMRLIDVVPGETVSVQTALPAVSCKVEVGILDPLNDMPGVTLAMCTPQEDGWALLFDWITWP
ncbi:MAG: DUF4832 domain-containing protein [Candidatus Ventricola sp.]